METSELVAEVSKIPEVPLIRVTDNKQLLYRQVFRLCPQTHKPTASSLLPPSKLRDASVDLAHLVLGLRDAHSLLSSYHEQQISFEFFTKILNNHSEGILTISVSNCCNSGLEVFHQEVTTHPVNPAHAIILYPNEVSNQQRKIANALYREIASCLNFVKF